MVHSMRCETIRQGPATVYLASSQKPAGIRWDDASVPRAHRLLIGATKCSWFQTSQIQDYLQRHRHLRCRRAVSVHLSVWVSITFVYSIEMSKDIFIIFHRRVETPFSVFNTKRYGNILTRGVAPNGGVECRWGRENAIRRVGLTAKCYT